MAFSMKMQIFWIILTQAKIVSTEMIWENKNWLWMWFNINLLVVRHDF